MRLTSCAETPIQTRGINHRVGTFRYKHLAEGQPGTPENFNLRMVWSQQDFFSPRHRHNFDQVRVQISGAFSFARDGKMFPGSIAYFPEGTPYGPQSSADETLALVLQLGGASGEGYLSEAEREAAVRSLSAHGEFRNGRFFRTGENAARGKDGFQAVWEHANGKPMRYPKPRYQRPIFIRPEAYRFLPVSGESGVTEKLLGMFNERGTAVSLLHLAPQARHSLAGPRLYFALRGVADAAGNRLLEHDTLYVESGETIPLAAHEETELLVFHLPRFEERSEALAA